MFQQAPGPSTTVVTRGRWRSCPAVGRYLGTGPARHGHGRHPRAVQGRCDLPVCRVPGARPRACRVRGYLGRNFDAESGIECRFGEPITTGDRAAVEWWASWVEDGQTLTLAGVTILRFGPDGLVVDHRDYWNQLNQREPPYPGW
jgi:hypothetical protein